MLKYLKPLWWLNAVATLLRDVFGGILRALGLMRSSPTCPAHDNTQVDDVIVAAKTAAGEQAEVEALAKTLSPAQVVHTYCRMTADERKSMDLGVLTPAQQDWLLHLSDADCILLANESVTGCARSLEALRVIHSKPRKRVVEAPPSERKTMMTDTERRDFVRARFRQLMSQAQGSVSGYATPRTDPPRSARSLP